MNLILDSGYGVNGDQVVDLDSATVGVADGTTYTETFTPQAASAFAQTCDLPEATLRVTKLDSSPDGQVNEVPVQNPLFDTGNTFRTVECKHVQLVPTRRWPGTTDRDLTAVQFRLRVPRGKVPVTNTKRKRPRTPGRFASSVAAWFQPELPDPECRRLDHRWPPR
jgi:hypothetical protein